MDGIDLDTRLACRFYGEPFEFTEILQYLAVDGWVVIDRKLEKHGIEVEYIAKSIDGSEMLFSLRNSRGLTNLKIIENFFKTLLNYFWFVDVYHCFKGLDVRKTMEKIGLRLEANNIVRLKLGRTRVLIEGYPLIGKLVVSYRIGLRELNDVKKIYSNLLCKISTLKVKEHE